jgi:hypothetical protein
MNIIYNCRACLLSGALGLAGRVGQREHQRPLVGGAHNAHHLLAEGARLRRDADEARGPKELHHLSERLHARARTHAQTTRRERGKREKGRERARGSARQRETGTQSEKWERRVGEGVVTMYATANARTKCQVLEEELMLGKKRFDCFDCEVQQSKADGLVPGS